MPSVEIPFCNCREKLFERVCAVSRKDMEFYRFGSDDQNVYIKYMAAASENFSSSDCIWFSSRQHCQTNDRFQSDAFLLEMYGSQSLTLHSRFHRVQCVCVCGAHCRSWHGIFARLSPNFLSSRPCACPVPLRPSRFFFSALEKPFSALFLFIYCERSAETLRTSMSWWMYAPRTIMPHALICDGKAKKQCHEQKLSVWRTWREWDVGCALCSHGTPCMPSDAAVRGCHIVWSLVWRILMPESKYDK